MLDNLSTEKKASKYKALKISGWGNTVQAWAILCKVSTVMEECIVGVKLELIFNDFRKSCNLWSVKGTVGIAYIIKEALIAAM